MRWSFLLCPILCVLFMLFSFPSYSSSLNILCNLDEASALLQLKNSFTLDNSASELCVDFQSSYPKTESWKNGTDCCMWDGVTCDTLSGHVIGLDLSSSWLHGELHPNNSIFQLTHLQTLNLSCNFFSGSQISSKFGGFWSLTHLDLSYSAFIGEIPYEISYLSKLVSIDLSWNWYGDGSFILEFEPSTWRNFIQNVTDLRDLHLELVNMSLVRPNYLSLLSNLSSSLVSLYLHDNQLQGVLTNNILHLPKLQLLDLSWNRNLRVQLPKSNWSTPLKHLDLSVSDFSRQTPNSISYLKSLNFLSLDACRFQGPIPQSFSNLTQLTFLSIAGNNFSGHIPASLSNLKHLTELHLYSNNFSGQIQPTISYLQNLSLLSLSSNNFQGLIPFSLSNLQHLIYLDLSDNNFDGEIPSSLSKLQNLNYLDLSSNNLSGQIPYVLSQLSQLESLSLSNNNLVGQLPWSFFNLTNIVAISCSNNKLEGPIPKNITRLSNLSDLNLANNFLNGTIPSWFFSLPSLTELDLHSNQLTGHVSEFSSYSLESIDLSSNMLQNNIPKSMFHLTNLTYLSLASNNLSGVLDFHIFSKLNLLSFLDLSKNRFFSLMYEASAGLDFQNLESLDLSNNIIQGRIPKWLNDMGNKSLSALDLSYNFFSSVENFSGWSMRFLDLSFNLLEGNLPIPPFGIEVFSVSNNKLTGQISSVICNASSLRILNLSHNKLTGIIPECLGTLPYVSVLDLQVNTLSGTILRNISETNMFQTLKFNHNQLKGPLPRSMAHCKNLEILDLGDNEIEDTFPNWLEPLKELQVLVLRANQFHGAIVGLKSRHPFPKLRIFDVSNNHFSGPLPAAYMKEFQGMMGIDDSRIGLKYMTYYANYSSYNDSVVIIMKGVSMELTRILVTFTTTDLSNNQLEGEIPNAIGELSSLRGLNLSHNRITGNIPSSLGDLKSLEWLDLSSNRLIGEIPKALANLNYLSFLNLSQNQLKGVIPQGKQFNTFSIDSYEGDSGLCGFPLPKACDDGEGEHEPSSSIPHNEYEFGFGWKAVAVGYGCGFLFGVVMGYIVFSTGKAQWLVKLVAGEPKKRVRSTNRRVFPNRGRRN